MKYTNEFKEKAQNELSKRLGHNNLVECVQSLGSKQFKRKCDEFYSEYFKEMTTNELLILLNEKLNQNIIYTFDVYKDSVTIYGVEFFSKSIKLNKNIQEQFNQIFKQ